MRHELFEVGSYDYSDLDERLTKPVEWTEDDLKLIAENYRGGIPLTSEHDNIYVGIGNNIEYDEGKLFLEIPDELDMEGKGLSPKVDVLLKDNGDSFGIDTMSLIDVGVTKHPRKIRRHCWRNWTNWKSKSRTTSTTTSTSATCKRY